MSAISRRIDRFCHNHPRLGIPGLMRYIVIGNVFVFLMDMFSGYALSSLFSFSPYLIVQGQVWRLFTFLFLPASYSPIWFVLLTYLYYSIGTNLEQTWGTTRFSVYYFLGAYLNVALGFLIMALTGVNMFTPIMDYVNQTLFLAFATLYPETRFMIYFIIPVKAKWLAWISAAMLAISFGASLVRTDWLGCAMVVGSVLNYLIFFWGDLTTLVQRRVRRVAHRANPQTINFKKAQRDVQQRKGYLHKCAVCGLTDAQDSSMEFRYCSKCKGYYCYCMKHINDHTHIT